MTWNRRRFVQLASGLLVPSLGLPRRAQAATASERRFLFVFCDGGWDTSCVFTPLMDSPYADVEADLTTAEAGGITFVDAEIRPSVRAFFEDWGPYCCLINGMEVQSVTHERCRQLLLTGSGDGGDDWPSLIAAAGGSDLVMPHVILDGPAFTREHTSVVVRVGDDGQLPALLDASTLADSDQTIQAPSATAEALENAFVRDRAAARSDAMGTRYAEVLSQHQQMQSLSGVLALDGTGVGCERDIAADCARAFDCFELGISRCAMVRYKGWCSEGWDTHQGIELQWINFEDLFAYLNDVMADLHDRTGLSGNPLSEEVTIVLCSEMGREPRLNTWGGKDHWTFTSTLLIGAGVAGGQVIGAVDEYSVGQAVDLAAGGTSETGAQLLPDHLGATLLALADVDPEAHTAAPPITAVLA